MALNSEFFVKLGLQKEGFDKGLKEAGGEVDDLGKKLGGLEKETSVATKGLEGAGKAAEAAATGTKSFGTSLKGIKAALISTGIGILVVILGEIIAHWEDIIDYLDVAGRKIKENNELLKSQRELLALDLKQNKLIEDSLILQGKATEEIVKQRDKLLQADQLALLGQIDAARIAVEKLVKEADKVTFREGGLAALIEGRTGGVTSPEELLEIQAADKVLQDLENQLYAIGNARQKIANGPDIAKAIGIDKLPKGGEIDNLLQDSLDKQVAAGKRAYKGLSDYILDLEETTGQGQIQIRADVDEKLLNQKEDFLTALELFNEEVGNLLADGAADAISGFASGIGTALAEGTNVIDAIGGNLLSALGSFLQDFGKAAIAAGVAKIALDNLLSSGYGAVAAGVAAVAIGAAISSANKSANDFSGQSSGSSSSSGGGVSTTSFSGSGSGGDFNGRVVFEIAGDKLIGVLNNTSLGGLRVGDNELITTG